MRLINVLVLLMTALLVALAGCDRGDQAEETGRPVAVAPAEETGKPVAVAPAEETGKPVAVAPAEETDKPLAVVPAATYEFPPVVEGKEVVHDYVIRNEGTATLDIAKVKTG